MTISIRKSTKSDRDIIIKVADLAFEKSRDESFEFRYPMLFDDKRINEYYLAEDDGKVVGLLGAYKIDLIVNNVSFKACGIGKVACLKEYRNKGVMTSLLMHAVSKMKKQNFDISYLWGERFRYANFGWVEGGETQSISFWQKKMAPLVSDDNVKVVTKNDAKLVYKLLKNKFSYLAYSLKDIESAFDGKRLHGYRLNNSFVFWTYKKNEIIEALGDAKDILKLANFCLFESQKSDSKINTVDIETSKEAPELLEVLANFAWVSRKKSSANFRIINLKSFLEKFTKAVSFKLPKVSAELLIGSKEENIAFKLIVKNGEFSIKECDTKNAVMLNEKDLSEVFFGQFPLNAFLKDLPQNSVFRSVLPLTDLHISKFYLL